MNNRVDWEELRQGYNRIYKTDFPTVRNLMVTLYEKYGSITKLSEILGVSFPTVSKELKRYTTLKKRGGNNREGVKNKKFMNIPPERMATMTKLEIANECDMSIQYVELLIRKTKRKFVRTYNNTRYKENRHGA